MLIVSGHVDNPLTELWRAMEEPSSVKTSGIASPPPLSSGFEKADKKKAVVVHQSRFLQLEHTTMFTILCKKLFIKCDI